MGQYITYVVVTLVRTLLYVLEITMFLRALLSWFPIDEESRLMSFLYTVTEPVIQPVRALLYRLNLFPNSPLDVSFFITYIIIAILSVVL